MGGQNSLLSNRITELRAEHKMKQKNLAEKVGVSRNTIISIEKGNNPFINIGTAFLMELKK